MSDLTSCTSDWAAANAAYTATGIAILRSVMPPALLQVLYAQLSLLAEIGEIVWASNAMPGCPALIAPLTLEAALLDLMPLAEAIVGERLRPIHSLALFHRGGTTLDRPIDCAVGDVTVAVSLKAFDDRHCRFDVTEANGMRQSIPLPAGDALVFTSARLDQAEIAPNGHDQIQALFQYVLEGRLYDCPQDTDLSRIGASHALVNIASINNTADNGFRLFG